MRFFEFKNVDTKKVLNEDARIDHAEDIVFWEGSSGAIRTIEALRNLERGGHKDVTIKWDGSPALIFGRNENGEFILTDKSGFTAKGYDGRSKSAKDLESMLMARPGASNPDQSKAEKYKIFVGNMADIFDEYEKAVPKDFVGYYKGDLLYYNTPPVEDGEFVFTPNIVTYKVKANSEIGERIARSKTGVVIHRMIDEQGTESMLPPGVQSQFIGEEVLVFPPVTVTRPPEIDETVVNEMKAVVSKNAASLDAFLNTATLTQLKMKDLPKIFYNYVNNKVDTGLGNIGQDFIGWLTTKQGVSEPKKKRTVQYINENQKGFDAMWQTFIAIMNVKNDIINQFDSHDADIKAFIGGQEGGEGYVLAHPQGDIKLVNRAGFTAANRAVER